MHGVEDDVEYKLSWGEELPPKPRQSFGARHPLSPPDVQSSRVGRCARTQAERTKEGARVSAGRSSDRPSMVNVHF